MESGLLLDVVVGQRAAIFELLPREDQTLLVGRDACGRRENCEFSPPRDRRVGGLEARVGGPTLLLCPRLAKQCARRMQARLLPLDGHWLLW